ncbi:ISAzo13-like element transposase-related protein [Streptomyces celluloflavus]
MRVRTERAAVPFDGVTSALLIANVVQHWWTQEGSSPHARPGRLLVVLEAGPTTTCPSTLRQALSASGATLGVEVTVCHLPPATLRWHTLEHRLSWQVTARRESMPVVVEHITVSTIGPVPGHRVGTRTPSAPPDTADASHPLPPEPRER